MVESVQKEVKMTAEKMTPEKKKTEKKKKKSRNIVSVSALVRNQIELCRKRKEFPVYFFSQNDAYSFGMVISIEGYRGNRPNSEGHGSQTEVKFWNLTSMMEHSMTLRQFASKMLEGEVNYVGGAPQKSYLLGKK